MDFPVKIIITGPESTGKSEVSEKLAQYFGTSWSREYARIYLEENGPDYDFELLGKIAEQHLEHQEKDLAKVKDLIFMDTDLINYEVWSNVVFEKVHPFIKKNIRKEAAHQYLIMYPDIPWEPDPLRENPDDRLYIFEKHLHAITSRNRPYKIVGGWGEARIQNAIKAAKELLRTWR